MFKYQKISYLLIGVLVGVLASFSLASASGISNVVRLIVNGEDITFHSDVPPQIINGRTLVPARALAEKLGATVEWDEERNSVIVTSKNEPDVQPEYAHPLKLEVLSKTMYEYIMPPLKRATVTVKITNTTDKYVPFVKLTPIINVDDGRKFSSALHPDTALEGDYYKPNSSVILKYWTQIPTEIEIIDWKL